jgi:hypothetical protein
MEMALPRISTVSNFVSKKGPLDALKKGDRGDEPLRSKTSSQLYEKAHWNIYRYHTPRKTKRIATCKQSERIKSVNSVTFDTKSKTKRDENIFN